MELSVQNLRAFNLASIRNQTVHQLHVRHLQREKSHRHLVVGCNVLGHRQGERRLTHCRTSGNDDEIGGLPAARNIIELVIASGHTRQSVLVLRCTLNHFYRILDNRVYLGVVLLHVLLGEFEEGTLGMLHQLVNINRRVEGFCLDIAGKANELTRQEFLSNDTRMVFDVGRRRNAGTQFSNIGRTAYAIKIALLSQLVDHGHDIHRFLGNAQIANSRIDFLITGFIEALGIEHLADHGVGVLINHQRTEHGTLHIECLRLHMTKGIINRHLLALLSAGGVILFGHSN